MNSCTYNCRNESNSPKELQGKNRIYHCISTSYKPALCIRANSIRPYNSPHFLAIYTQLARKRFPASQQALATVLTNAV